MKGFVQDLELFWELFEGVPLSRSEFLFENVAVPHGHRGAGDAIDAARIATAAAGRSIGRPQIADAMVAAGYVADRREAFDRWLGSDRPAFVPRTGAAPEQVIATVHRAGGVIALAHPGRTKLPEPRLESLAAAGLDALEVYHPDHDETLIAHYASLAHRLGLLRTGGSDFHGDPSHGVTIGCSTLPAEYWTRLHAVAAH